VRLIIGIIYLIIFLSKNSFCQGAPKIERLFNVELKQISRAVLNRTALNITSLPRWKPFTRYAGIHHPFPFNAQKTNAVTKTIGSRASSSFSGIYHSLFAQRKENTLSSRRALSTTYDFSLPRTLILISLDWTRPQDPPLSLGHASILATLRSYDIDVREKAWSVNASDFNAKDVVDFILGHTDANTDVALGAFVWNESHVQNILSALKAKKFPGRIILGGPQISYVKQDVERYYPQADVFIRGYAEEALSQLMLSQKKYPSIKGVHYKDQPCLGLSAVADLPSLPSPFLTGIIPPQPFIRWETQRGCPFSCSFCQHRESDPTKKRRAFSSNRLSEEIEWIVSSLITSVAVLDATFNTGDHYLKVLKQFADKKYRGKLSLQCRIELVKPEFLDLVEQINEHGKVVLEFGLQTVHKEEMKLIQRENNMTKIRRVLPDIKNRDIEMEISLIFGLPKQTVASFQESINFCKDHGIPTIYGFPLMLLRGTPLYDQKHKLGLVESTDVNFNKIPRIQEGIPHVVSSPSFTFSDWLKMAELAESLENYNKNRG